MADVVIRFKGDASSAVRAGAQTQGALTGVGRAGSNVGATLRRALVVGGALVAGGLALAAKAAIDFESSFAGVEKTVDGTESQMARLAQGLRDMAKEIPVNVNELNRIAEAAGQLGIRRQAILGFTRTVADLGVTTNLVGDEAASALARISNIMGTSQKSFDRLGSTIVALGNAGASTEAEIVEMGLRIAGAGKQAGLSEADVLALANALSSVGIEAQAGGTAISRVMIDIAKAVRSGGDELDEFAKVADLSASDFRQAFEKDAAGAIVTFVEGLGKIGKEGGNVFKVLDDLGLSEIRVRDALLRAAGAGDLFRESLQLGSKAWKENTALVEEAEKRYDTTASQIQLLRNNVNDFAIETGQRLLPILNRAFEAGTRAVQQYGDEVIAVGEALTSGLGADVTLAIAAVAGFGIALTKTIAAVKALRLAIVAVNPWIAGLSIAVGLLAFAYLRSRDATDEFTEATERAKRALSGLKPVADAAAQADIELAAAHNNVKASAIAVKDAERNLTAARKAGNAREITRAEVSLETARIAQRRAVMNVTTAENANTQAKKKLREQHAVAARVVRDLSTKMRELTGTMIAAERRALAFKSQTSHLVNEERTAQAASRRFAVEMRGVAAQAGAAARQLQGTNPRLAQTARNAQVAASTMAALASAWGRVVSLPAAKAFVARFSVITAVEEHRLNRQHGGPVWPGQAFLVGERGRELAVFGRAGQIIPHEQTERLLRSGRGAGGVVGRALSVTVNLNGPIIGGGSRRELGRDLANVIAPELRRQIRLETP
ncbi:MAG: phage tail tape measure protein [Acidimicrobiia bacterium]